MHLPYTRETLDKQIYGPVHEISRQSICDQRRLWGICACQSLLCSLTQSKVVDEYSDKNSVCQHGSSLEAFGHNSISSYFVYWPIFCLTLHEYSC